MKSSKKFDINISSLISLKAELSRKQEEVTEAKNLNQAQFIHPVPKPKKDTVLTRKNPGVDSRDELDFEEKQELTKNLQKSKIALEAKTKLYEKLVSGATSDSDNKFLVNFEQKAYDEHIPEEPSNDEDDEKHNSDEYDHPSDPEEDWVDYTDCLGRTRRCLRRDLTFVKQKDEKLSESLGQTSKKEDNVVAVGSSSSQIVDEVGTPVEGDGKPELLSGDMRREMLRQKWEEQELKLRDKTDIHYQDVLYDEARSHGVGYYSFSSDEVQRKAEQAELGKLRQDTEKQQEAALSVRQRRQQQFLTRLKAARQRKRVRMGLPPEEEEQDTEDKKEDEEKAKATIIEAEEIKPKEEPKKRAPQQVRPWDIGKEGVVPVMSQEEWVKKRRTDRTQEFAPPPTYLEDIAASSLHQWPTKPKSTLFFTSKKPKPIRNEVEDNSPDSSDESIESIDIIETVHKVPKQSGNREKRGVEIAPPPTFEYYGPSSSTRTSGLATRGSDIEDSISAGLKYLRQQAEDREKQKEKGLLDII